MRLGCLEKNNNYELNMSINFDTDGAVQGKWNACRHKHKHKQRNCKFENKIVQYYTIYTYRTTSVDTQEQSVETMYFLAVSLNSVTSH